MLLPLLPIYPPTMKLNKATVALVLLLAAAAVPSSSAERRLNSPDEFVERRAKSTKGTTSGGNGIFFSSAFLPTASPTVSAAPSASQTIQLRLLCSRNFPVETCVTNSPP